LGLPEGVFSITSQGAKKVLANLTYPELISSRVVTEPNGRHYSANVFSGSIGGNMFSVGATPGDVQTYPTTSLPPSLVQGLPDGTLLGTAYDTSNFYHLVKCYPNGTVSSFYQFPAGETISQFPAYASDGNYYGVSSLQDGSGYVYRVTASGSRTNLYSFPSGTFVYGAAAIPTPVIQASDGNLYGSTGFGGTNGTGTIYKLTLAGQYTLLYTFPAGVDYNPTALLEGSDGNLYGATWARNGQGIYQLFRVTTSGQYTQIFAMTNGVTEGMCFCWLTMGSDGVIYGSAQNGGYTGAGVIFALNIPMPKPAPSARQFSPQSGPAGTKVLIWGYNLLSASVDFNGTPASSVSNGGPNYVWATVPAGASSGPITVTTPGGVSTTQASFTVE
jgi:uncharacterized repeat protein (TIGR03803 family)